MKCNIRCSHKVTINTCVDESYDMRCCYKNKRVRLKKLLCESSTIDLRDLICEEIVSITK